MQAGAPVVPAVHSCPSGHGGVHAVERVWHVCETLSQAAAGGHSPAQEMASLSISSIVKSAAEVGVGVVARAKRRTERNPPVPLGRACTMYAICGVPCASSVSEVYRPTRMPGT